MPQNDKLDEIFSCQKMLNSRIGVDTDSMSEEEQVKWLLNYCRALSQEIAELTDSVPWKWWAKYQSYDRQNVRVEIVDMLHFLVSLAQVAGMEAKDVHYLYMEKNRVNFERQDSGYTTKDESDNEKLKIDK